jgi:hypothetical protein
MNSLQSSSTEFVADTSHGRLVWNSLGIVSAIVNLNWVYLSHLLLQSVKVKCSVSNGSGLPGFGPGQELPRNRTAQVLAGCYPDRTYTPGFLAGFEPDRGSNFKFPTTWAPIKFLSSDRIMTWWIRRLSNCMSSCTSSNQICDPTDIRRVAVK